MSKWEKELRERLEKEIPDGAYDISSPGFTCWTGRLGYIDFLVALEKEFNKYRKNDKNI